MVFLISLVIAVCFVQLCGETLRKHPAPFYAAAAILSIAAVCVTNLRLIGIPAWVNTYLLGQLTKGTLATACWAIVMWTGALPNRSALMKRWMPVRGQLSIFAAILTLGHAVGYGISYLPRWIEKADAANLIVCIGMMLIMLPLTVISVRKIRQKFKAKVWKMWQRFAYLFYALIPLHVLLLNFSRAKAGRSDAFFSLMLYLAVFLGYAVCRVRKQILQSKKPERRLALNSGAAAMFLVIFGAAVMAAMPKKPAETVHSAEESSLAAQETTTTAPSRAIVQSDTAAQTTLTAAETTSRPAQDPAEAAETTAPPETTAAESQPAETTLSASESAPAQTEAPPAQSEAPVQSSASSTSQTTQTSAAPRIYQNGTFTASAYGYDGEITVHVTIQDDKITEITAETEESDDSYFFDAKRAVLPAIVSSQSAEVDACSGATYSSKGIMEAVRKALDSARA